MLKNKSYFKKSTGDEAGCAPKKGLINSKNTGKVYFIAWSMTVKFEGENVVRNLDMTTHNHASPPNGAAPMTHVAAVALANFDKCGNEAQAIQTECGDNKHPPCPGALGVPVEKGGQKDWVREQKGGTPKQAPSSAVSTAMSHHAPAVDTGESATKNAGRMATADATPNPCVQAMRCFLRPYGNDSDPKDGVSSCCPGQTGHHIPPWSTVETVSGTGLTHGGALCICLEGMNQSVATHGKHHHGTNFLLDQQSKNTSSSIKQGPSGTFTAPLQEHVKVAAAVTEAQTECSKECVEQQLNKQFGEENLKKDATHNANTTGGMSLTQLNAVDKLKVEAAWARAPRGS